MVCLVINSLLGLMLVVYLSLGNERPTKIQFQQREYFTGGVSYNTSMSSIVECIVVCMDHLPQCWAVRYTKGIKHCELFWHAKNQTPITIVADVDRNIFRMVQLYYIVHSLTIMFLSSYSKVWVTKIFFHYNYRLTASLISLDDCVMSRVLIQLIVIHIFITCTGLFITQEADCFLTSFDVGQERCHTW